MTTVRERTLAREQVYERLRQWIIEGTLRPGEIIKDQDLAARLEVKPPSLYSHVGGTEALRTGVTLRSLSELADLVATAIAGRSGRDALVALADAHRAYALQHPGRFAACRRRIATPETVDLSPGRRHAELNAAVLRGYDLPESDLVHATRLVAATVAGFLVLESTGAFDHSPPAPPDSWARTISALDASLSTWGDSCAAP